MKRSRWKDVLIIAAIAATVFVLTCFIRNPFRGFH